MNRRKIARASAVRIRAILLALAAVLAMPRFVVGQQPLEERELRPGECFVLAVESDPTVCGLYGIAKDGSVSMPPFGKLSLAGLTVPLAEAAIGSAWRARFGHSPGNVTLTRLARAGSGVTYRGAVRFSGSLPARPSLKLADVVAMAAPTESADLGAVRIVSSSGETLAVAFDPGRLESPDSNPRLKEGDAVFFPTATRPNVVLVAGAVERPGNVPFRVGLTAREAVALAGGEQVNADLTRVRVERGGELVDTVNFQLGYDSRLQRGDVVRVSLVANPKYVYLVGGIAKEGRYDLRPGWTLTQAILAAGGEIAGANIKRITIARRVRGALRRTRYDLEAIRSRQKPDVFLEAGDIIEVPAGGGLSAALPVGRGEA